MIGPKASAGDGSTAVGGNNNGTITNLTVGDGSTVALHLEAELARKLPSHLGAFIAQLAFKGGLTASSTQMRPLPPEVADKLRHNQLPVRHPIIRDWIRHSLALERAYHGVEQQNADARYLVRQRAGAVYEEELLKAAQDSKIPEAEISEFARHHAIMLVQAVTDRLLVDYRASKTGLVEEEIARLAVSLVVADAVVECEVLEKPSHATAP
ncbi:MAG: hypothetical protein HZB64_02445 [Rhodocyclales bacterium]|nr:hypothetical protein [Rhodocyclales bacterium]